MSSVDDISPPTPNFDKLKELLQCSAQRGCKVAPNAFAGGYSTETGKGLYALRDLKKGKLLFCHYLNGHSLLNLSTALYFRGESSSNDGSDDASKLNATLSSIPRSGLKAKTYAVDDFFGTTVALMLEMPFVSSSYLGPYLQWLPTCFPLSTALDRQELDSPMLWSAAELLYLEGTSVYRAVKHFEASSREKFEEVVLSGKRLCEYLSAVGLSSEQEKWQYFKFCACIVQAYSFTINKEDNDYEQNSDAHSDSDSDTDTTDSARQQNIAPFTNTMIPLMDAFNASNERQNVHLLIDTKRNVLECRTTARVSAGEELFNTFGVMDAADRIIKYGYMEAHDAYPLMFTLRDVADVLSQSAWTELLFLILPNVFHSGHIAKHKRKRGDYKNTATDETLSTLGHIVVQAVQQKWKETKQYEEFFSVGEFMKDLSSATCMFVVEDFLDSREDENDENRVEENSLDSSGISGDSDSNSDNGGNSNGSGSCSDDGNSDEDADNDDYAEGLDLEQFSIFSFLTSIVEYKGYCRGHGSEDKEVLVKDEENNVYFETMILFHLLVKSRLQLLVLAEDRSARRRLDARSRVASCHTDERRIKLCKDVTEREKLALEKYVLWSRGWLQSRAGGGASGHHHAPQRFLGSSTFKNEILCD
jgi:hypothetical protein